MIQQDKRFEPFIKFLYEQNACMGGVNQFERSQTMDEIITITKFFHRDALKNGWLSTEILQRFEAIKEFEQRSCYFGLKGDKQPKENTLIVDCELNKLTINKEMEYVSIRNSKIENIYINAPVRLLFLYNNVTVKNIDILGSSVVTVMKLINSSIKVLRLDTNAKIQRLSRATKTINEIVNKENILKIEA